MSIKMLKNVDKYEKVKDAQKMIGEVFSKDFVNRMSAAQINTTLKQIDPIHCAYVYANMDPDHK